MRPLPEPNPAFRESFLAEWGETEDAAALRRYGALLNSLGCETDFMVSRAYDERDPRQARELRAAMVDLEAVAEILGEAGSDDVGVSSWETGSLRSSAATWARQLRRIGASMERAAEEAGQGVRRRRLLPEPETPEARALAEALEAARQAAKDADEHELGRVLAQVRILHHIGAIDALRGLLAPMAERSYEFLKADPHARIHFDPDDPAEGGP